jgi:hypothetical protein
MFLSIYLVLALYSSRSIFPLPFLDRVFPAAWASTMYFLDTLREEEEGEEM